jgi:hypothetical protein
MIHQIRSLDHRRRVLSGGAEPNGLLTNLVAYWPGDEASGNALDAHTNALHLTDTNTVTSNPGHVYSTARQYTSANSEYHIRADNALLSTGDIDYTLAAWAYLDSNAAAMYIAGKFITAIGEREYRLLYVTFPAAFRWTLSSTGSNATQIDAVTFGAPSLSTWYLVVGSHDSVANIGSIQVNNGALDSLAHANGYDSPTAFAIGAQSDGSGCWDGRIGPVMFWKSAAGGGGVLSAAQRTALWNGGAGLRYDQFTL